MPNSFINIKTIHIFSWLGYFALLTIVYSSIHNLDFALYRASQMVIVQASLFYLNTLVLIPDLLEKRKYTLYILSIIALIFAAVGLISLLNYYVNPFGDLMPVGKGLRYGIKPDIIVDSNGEMLNKPFFRTRGILRNLSSVIAIILFSLVYRLLFLKISEEKREAAIRNEHLLSEMKFLKSQVNPHFLFNALNNIYTLVHLKHDRAPAMLLKLSDMLRYMLYECDDEWVPLVKEINYINNYIELQQLKTEQAQNIVTDFEEVDKTTLIPPLLLIPYIENSFKHSRIEDIETGWVSMHLDSSDKHLHFIIANRIPLVPIAKDETGGIGLENARRRLELLYPNKYNLKINETGQEFTIDLYIDMK